ncbi:acyl carrier protein [Streptomyces xinghaiensis]|uniref:acyl carrier protein n=1 Tax=Streptomyces TaxID=1883 RepID=UPI000ABFF04C|nr:MULTISPECIES: acyl carrier protein [Streptomyces]
MELTVEQQVRDLLVHEFGVDPAEVKEGASLEGLGIDSLALEELRVVAQDHFRTDLENARISKRDTVGALIRLVETTTTGMAGASS